MSKTRVLEVIRQGQIGGGESHLLDLVYFMDPERYQPVCLSFTDGEMVSRLRAMGITCHVIESSKAFDVSAWRQVAQLLRQEHIHLVHAHGSRAASNVLLPTHRLHLPMVYTVHGWSFHDDQSPLIRRLRSASEWLICRGASRVICVSQSNAETGRRVFGLRQAEVIENGINLDIFSPHRPYPALRPTLGLSPTDFVMAFIARSTKQKGPIVFLDAVRQAHEQHPEVKGLFVGQGDMDDEVDAYISAHQMESYVVRSPFRTDVPALLQAADVYCLPSLWEGLSIALLEAMAMGKPIIATPTDGTRELITHGENGLVVPFGDATALSEAMLLLKQDEALRQRCSRNAHAQVERRFNAQRVADSVMGVYDELLLGR